MSQLRQQFRLLIAQVVAKRSKGCHSRLQISDIAEADTLLVSKEKPGRLRIVGVRGSPAVWQQDKMS
jgi:hypothetical protein